MCYNIWFLKGKLREWEYNWVKEYAQSQGRIPLEFETVQYLST